MTFNRARLPDTPLSEETVKVELSELKSTTRILDVADSSATLGGLTLGALAAGRRAFINQVIGLNGITFQRPGDYAFSILVGGETKETVGLHVNEPNTRGG